MTEISKGKAYEYNPERLTLTLDLRENDGGFIIADETGELARKKLSKLAEELRKVQTNPLNLAEHEVIAISYGIGNMGSKQHRAYDRDRKIISEFVRKKGMDGRIEVDTHEFEDDLQIYVTVSKPAKVKAINYGEPSNEKSS